MNRTYAARRGTVILITVGALLIATAPAAAADPALAVAAQHQSEVEALRQDLTLVAEANGWTYEEAAAQHAAAEAVGAIAEQVAARRPDIFVGSELSDRPGGAPTLYLKGSADRWVRSLVGQSDLEINIVDGQARSFLELERRQLAVHEFLTGQGFAQVSSGVDITGGGSILADVTIGPDSVTTAAEVAAMMPADLRPDLRLTVNREPVAVPEHAFGGNWVRSNGTRLCTSGWSVVNLSTGTTGVTTAGHCTGINEIEEPGVGVWDLTHQAQHRGQWGDVEWKVSPAHIEPPQFFATATAIRDVTSLEPRAGISVGESICMYGRSSNSRDCGLEVAQTTWSCTLDGFNTRSLVRMNGDVTIGGDSGGGWSFNFRAYGSHVGDCSSNNVFTVADLFDEALNVRVRLA